MPQTRLELVLLAEKDFKSFVSTIPPPGLAYRLIIPSIYAYARNIFTIIFFDKKIKG
jgi:hypothetical protein